MLQDNPHRFSSWYWTGDPTFTADTADHYLARAKAVGAQLIFMMGVIEPVEWGIDATKFPNGLNGIVAKYRAHGLKVGLHTLPYAPTGCTGACAKAGFVREGMAPTFRSGFIGNAPVDLGINPVTTEVSWKVAFKTLTPGVLQCSRTDSRVLC